jgi:hypothetical protein
MKLYGRMNWILFAVLALLIGGNLMIFLYPLWQVIRLKEEQSRAKNQPSCLKTSDFYSVHLTTYYLAASGDGALDPKEKAKRRYDPYCDRIPGTGQVMFTVDLMEQDTRKMPVALSLSQYSSEGRLALVKGLPPSLHPGGVLTLDVPIAERGKYLLKVVFGAAKSKDDIIEMPILVGQ